MVDQAILVNGSVQDFNDQDEQFKSTIQNLKRFIGASSKKVIDKIQGKISSVNFNQNSKFKLKSLNS